jgi:hypothetical protein
MLYLSDGIRPYRLAALMIWTMLREYTAHIHVLGPQSPPVAAHYLSRFWNNEREIIILSKEGDIGNLCRS